MESSNQHNTPQVIHNINDEEQLLDENEFGSEMSTFENENLRAPRTSNKILRKSTNKRNYSQISSIEDPINTFQAISNSCKGS